MSYEVELDGPVDEQPLKVVAPRGRLISRIDAWNAAAQEAYGRICFARADELVAAAPERLGGWAPPPEIPLTASAQLGFMTARIAEQLGGTDAHVEERKRQSTWLVEQLELDRLARRLVPGCRLISQ